MVDTSKNISIDSVLSGVKERALEKASGDMDPMSDENKRIVKMADELFAYAKMHKEIPMQRAARNYLAYVGKQWDLRQPSFKTIPVTNIIWGLIEYEVPLMTENKPIMQVLPGNKIDVPYATGATKGLEYVWDSNDMTFRLPFIMRNVLVLGDSFLKIYWDYNLQEVIIDDVEPDYLYPEPYVGDIKKCNYVIHAEPRPLYEIYELYPNGK
jgi:hypothetical protein